MALESRPIRTNSWAYRWLLRYSWPLYDLTLLLMAVTLIFSVLVNGAADWLRYGLFGINVYSVSPYLLIISIVGILQKQHSLQKKSLESDCCRRQKSLLSIFDNSLDFLFDGCICLSCDLCAMFSCSCANRWEGEASACWIWRTLSRLILFSNAILLRVILSTLIWYTALAGDWNLRCCNCAAVHC